MLQWLHQTAVVWLPLFPNGPLLPRLGAHSSSPHPSSRQVACEHCYCHVLLLPTPHLQQKGSMAQASVSLIGHFHWCSVFLSSQGALASEWTGFPITDSVLCFERCVCLFNTMCVCSVQLLHQQGCTTQSNHYWFLLQSCPYFTVLLLFSLGRDID